MHYTKEHTRELAIAQAKESPTLCSGGVLRCDWLELAGEHAPTASLLAREGLLSAGGRFVGIDRSPDVIADCARRYGGPDFVWVQKELTEAIQCPTLGNAGVLVYDSWDGLQCSNLPGKLAAKTRRNLEPVLSFALRQRAKLGEFLLVLNYVQRGEFSHATIQEYTGFLSARLGVAVAPTRMIFYRSTTCKMAWTAIRL